jgi:predicted nucleic acid-binding protein
MIVVADTSPLNYLVLIDQIRLLPALYQRVLIPEAVLTELRRPCAPKLVGLWIATPPPWLEICAVHGVPDESLLTLDPGERDAILLALERGVGVVLMDEAEGRREAERHNVRVAGTLAVLEQGAQRGLIDLPAVIDRLRQTNFRLSSNLIQKALDRDANRKNRNR